MGYNRTWGMVGWSGIMTWLLLPYQRQKQIVTQARIILTLGKDPWRCCFSGVSVKDRLNVVTWETFLIFRFSPVSAQDRVFPAA